MEKKETLKGEGENLQHDIQGSDANADNISVADNIGAEEDKKGKKESKRKGKVWPWVRDMGIAVLIAVIILQFIKPTVVKEHSMEPTLYENNYIVISKQSYTLFGDIEHGDIIVFESDMYTEDGDHKLLIKRVVGLPGDVISVSDGMVSRNGEVIDEPYIKGNFTPGEVYSQEVPEGQLFVMGDNRENSLDSRNEEVGLVNADTVIGKAVFRILPFSEIGSLD